MVFVTALASALIFSLGVSYLTIRLAHRYEIGLDADDAGLKAHIHAVPRLGAVPIAIGLAVALGVLCLVHESYGRDSALLLVVLLPALGIGLIEDIFQSLGGPIRLFMTMVSAVLAWWLLDARLTSVDSEPIDSLLATYPLAALAITVFAASGLSHAINIVDGCNGLSGFVSMVILCAIAAVARASGDQFVCSVSLVSAAAVLGFFVWNFPFGRLFLGDGGAYLSGMLIATLSLMLVCRNSDVSPWFPVVLAIYPIWETLYSAWRRIFVRGRSPGSADHLHMHSLVYQRLVRSSESFVDARTQALQSSLASVYMWAFALSSAVPALLFWSDSGRLQWSCVLFACTYIVLYRALVRFRLQKVLKYRRSGPDPKAEAGLLGSD